MVLARLTPNYRSLVGGTLVLGTALFVLRDTIELHAARRIGSFQLPYHRRSNSTYQLRTVRGVPLRRSFDRSVHEQGLLVRILSIRATITVSTSQKTVIDGSLLLLQTFFFF
jgi:hypothetical protein